MVTAVLQALAPTAAYVFAWPLLAGGLSFAASGGGSGTALRDRVIQMLIAGLTRAWIGSLMHSLMVGLDMPALEILPTLMAALVIWPLASTEAVDDASLWPAGCLFVGSALIAAFLHLTSPWTQRHPANAEPVFVIDPAAHQAWRASLTPLDAWMRGVLTAEGGAIGPRTFIFGTDPLQTAPATYQPADPPAVRAVAGANGTVTLTATPHAGAARIIIRLRSPTGIDAVYVDGARATEQRRGKSPKPFAVAPDKWGAVQWAAPDAMTMTLHTSDPSRLEINATEIYDRWMSAKPLPPTPPTEQMWSLAGSTYVASEVRVER